MLRLQNIVKNYVTSSETVNALKGVSLAFRKNEFVSVLGPSGCGKTTLLNIIGGLDHYNGGDLIINGKSTQRYTDRDWDVYRNHRIGFIFQSYNLIPHQTVLGNVELALTISGISKEERIEKAKKALDRVGLSDKYYKKPNQLSGGQCQRVAIARALVNDPEILLADEPTGALDTVTSVQIMDLIKEISAERLVIMVTHNPELAEKYSSRIVRLLDGQVLEDTNPFSEEDEIAECEQNAEKQRISDEKALEEMKANGKKPDPKKLHKKENAKMSLWTAFKLSARNLISKRARTTMVGIAGSIGIIGIAMVLAFSNGIRGYVTSMQDDMLSGNPITITEMTYDLNAMTQMMSAQEKEEIIKEPGKVYIDSIIARLTKNMNAMQSLMIKNEISENYVDYILAMPEEYRAAILLGYGISLENNLYTDFNENAENSYGSLSITAIKQIYTSILQKTDYAEYSTIISTLSNPFAQAPDNEEYILSQYDVLSGKIATEKDEIMIVLNGNDRLNDILLARLGYYSQDEFINIIHKADENEHYDPENDKPYFTYEELLGKSFTWYPNDSVYEKTQTGFGYTAQAPESNDGALNVKVVGIIRAKETISFGCLTSGVYYTGDLAKHVVESAENSEIVKNLIESEKDSYTSMSYNGIPMGITYKYSFNYDGESYSDIIGFVGDTSSMAGLMMGGMAGGSGGTGSTGGNGGTGNNGSTSGSTGTTPSLGAIYTLSLRSLGGIAIPNTVYIYPQNFDMKDMVTKYLDAWNDDGVIEINGINVSSESRSDITYTDTLELIIDMINNMINIVSTALIAFTSISLVVSTVMIGIITYVSVVERIKEIGVIRSLGGRKKDVSRLFTAETFIIGMLAGLIGIGVTYVISAIANVIIYSTVQIPNIAALSLRDAIFLVCLSTGLTLISGVMPARSAARKDPVVALRTE